MVTIRPVQDSDEDALWAILSPILAAGESYALPHDMTREKALAFWRGPGYAVFVAEDEGRVVGTYFLRPNGQGGACHVCNCGYATASGLEGRGIASAMCAHSLAEARERGYRAMQYNFVVSANVRAVALWQRHGFKVVGQLPKAFHHPKQGYVDAFVMFRDV